MHADITHPENVFGAGQLVREIDEMTVKNDKNDNNEQVKHELVKK